MSGNIANALGAPVHRIPPRIVGAPEVQLRDAIERAGLTPPSTIHLDGKLHRFDADTKGGKSGWYVAYSDGVPAGSFGCWRAGLENNWSADVGRDLSAAEITEQRKRMEEARRIRDAALAEQYAAAAEACRAIWSSAPPAPADHPYLARKRIQPHHARVHADGRLILPLIRTGELVSLQYIAPDGGKLYHPGGRASGAYSKISGKADGPVYVAEGFATAATIAENTGCRVVIAYSAGQLMTATAHARTLANDVVIVADNDSNGVGPSKARAAAAAHGARWCMPPTVGQDANDYALAGGDLKALLREAKLERPQHVDTEPEPLRRPLPKPQPYPVEALGPVLAGAVEALAKTVQAPDAVAANCVLTAASLAVQGHADVQQDMIRAPLSLFLLTVAESGERKTGTDVAMRPFDDRRKLELQVYRELQADHERELKEHTTKRAAAERQCKDGDGLADALKALGEPPRPPRQPTRTMENVTLEGVFKSLQLGCQSQALTSDEGAIVFGGHSMTQDHKLRLIATLSKLWDGKPIDRVRQDGGYLCLEGRRLASHLMIQPVVAEKVLSDDDMVGQGLMARFLIAWPESKIGWRPYAARSAFADPLMVRYCHRIAELIAMPHPIDAEDPEQPLAPRTITLSPEAAAEWIAFHDDLEVKQRPEGPLVEARAWASKMAQQALRLAGVLAMVENPAVAEIPAETMRRALTLAAWYMSEASRLCSASVTPRPIRDAETLLQWIHASGRQAVYSQLLQNKGPRSVGRDKASLDRALEVLVGAGYLIPLPEGTVLDDKPRRRAWRVWQRSASRMAA